MAYTSDDIIRASGTFYYLLKNGQLALEDDRAMYKEYSENENIMNLVKLQAEECDCSIQRYSGVIYMIPHEENEFLGFSKAELKRELCRANANDKDYYLSQFVILVLLSQFYGSSGKTSKSRSFMKFGELLNAVGEALKSASEKENLEDIEKRSGIAFTNILERWDALKGSEKSTTSKTTKEGFATVVLNFLENQGLISFIKDDDMIFTKPKLDNFMDWDILNKNNYDRIQEAFREVTNEQD
jgi:hypothetical protein